MKILDESNNILDEATIDYEAGYLVEDTITIKHPAVEAVAEQGHYVTTAEFPNGGKVVEWVVDVAGVTGCEAWTETEEVLRFVPFTAEEIASRQIENLNIQLRSSDTDVLEALEGLLSSTTLDSFLSAMLTAAGRLKETLEARRSLRAEIAALEKGTN